MTQSIEAEGVAEVVEEVALVKCQPQQLPGKPGMLQHWRALLLTLSGDGGGNDDNFQLQGGLVLEQKGRLKSKWSVAGGEAEVHQARQ